MNIVKEAIGEIWKHEKFALITVATIGIFILAHAWISKPSNKTINRSDLKGASIGTYNQNTYNEVKKRFEFFVEPYAGVSTNKDSRAEGGARTGVRFTF